MSTDRDVTRIVRSWMDEGVTALPDRVLDAVLDQVPATPQRRATWWPARRISSMSSAMRLGIAAAVVAVTALLGYTYFLAPNVGDDTDQPTPPPAPTSIFGTTDLAPGTYAIADPFPVEFEMTLPDGWETWGAGADIVRIWKPCVAADCEGFSAILDFEIVRATLDPCQGNISSSFGESVEALVGDLASLPGHEAGTVTDVSVDAYEGKAFDLRFVGPLDATCDEGAPWQWLSSERVTWGPDAQQRVIVLDADGTRLVIDEIVYFGDRAEMDAIVDSIDFN